MWVVDATPLIYLAKVERLSLVQHLDPTCVIPERVYDEVVATGLEEGYPDARRIDRRIDAGVIDVVAVEETPLVSRLRTNDSISDADVAVLAHAGTHDGVAVMDETYGRDVAAAEGITTRGTAYIILVLAKQGRISIDEAQAAIDEMVEEGWYCAPDVYTRIIRKLESLQD